MGNIMSRGDPHRKAFKAAADATRARIRRDRAHAPASLKKLFTVVSRRLFDPELNAGEAWKAAGIKDRAMGIVFKASTNLSLKQYIEARRIEVGTVLILLTDLDLFSISEKIGYALYPTFADAYKRQKKMLPSEVVREYLPPPLIEDATSLRVGRGLLDDEEIRRHVEELKQIYPTLAEGDQSAGCLKPEPLIIVDGAADDLMKAEDLWRKIRDLPFDEQCRMVRGHLFRSTVLFDLLRNASRLEGHKNRQRGIDLAKLALISLVRSDEVFGGRIHDLRALSWAWIANAYRLALDFSAAAAAFEQADREWSTPRAKHDLLVLANIHHLKGALRMVQRDYTQGIQELNQSCSLFRQSGQERDEAHALIYRAMIRTYAGDLDEAVEDFREAAGLIDEDQDKQLAFAIRGNLAATFVRAGHVKSAVEQLDRARQLKREIDAPIGTIKLDWISADLSELHGDLEKAKSLYQAARAGFSDADEPRYYGLVSVDLMIVYSMQENWEKVGELAVSTLPLLTSMQLHSETVAAVGLLAEAVEAQDGLSQQLLKDLQTALRQDPLAM